LKKNNLEIMKNFIIIFVVIYGSLSCTKKETLTPSVAGKADSIKVMEGTKEAIGAFMDGAHPTSGKVTLVTDKTDKTKQYLSFENFKTDAGPDLRIYLAEDLKANGFVELSKLDKTGNFVVSLPANAMTDKQKYVLVWCKQFSVLFGSAKLE
jgi:Electron transfer DM13